MRRSNELMFGLALYLLIISGCAYYSKTAVTIVAEKASYPIGLSSVTVENGMINIHREMTTKGLKDNVDQTAAE